ncbi:hypothetical protein EVAR_28664_1 [Eumeta japonica]|uniref:Uncharacterized protein n=1 Tax=Eumeta variegata TaxID=151549 RepID=A0A4C1V4I7_EUMVA|nr:hypothetical protein EVAR_28664_1 [Eumeta japonica]
MLIPSVLVFAGRLVAVLIVEGYCSARCVIGQRLKHVSTFEPRTISARRSRVPQGEDRPEDNVVTAVGYGRILAHTLHNSCDVVVHVHVSEEQTAISNSSFSLQMKILDNILELQGLFDAFKGVQPLPYPRLPTMLQRSIDAESQLALDNLTSRYVAYLSTLNFNLRSFKARIPQSYIRLRVSELEPRTLVNDLQRRLGATVKGVFKKCSDCSLLRCGLGFNPYAPAQCGLEVALTAKEVIGAIATSGRSTCPPRYGAYAFT